MPTTATVANNASAAPPSTECGIPATMAAVFGSTPRMIMMPPAAAITQRLFTWVSRTRPTFSEKQVYGNEFMTPPMVVASPSARSALGMSSFLIRLPTISPVA